MTEHIQHDTEEIWRGAAKVLALQMLVDQLMTQMRQAAVAYDHAFGVDPEDKTSREGRKQYAPRRDAGLEFCNLLGQLLGLQGGTVQQAGSVLEGANEAAADAAGGKGR